MKNETILRKRVSRRALTPGCSRWSPIVLSADPVRATDAAEGKSDDVTQTDLKSPVQPPETKKKQSEL